MTLPVGIGIIFSTAISTLGIIIIVTHIVVKVVKGSDEDESKRIS